MGFETASHLSLYTCLVEVVSGAFGGKKDSKPTEDLSQASPEHFAARVGQLLSI